MHIITITEQENNSRLDRVIKRIIGKITQSFLEKLLRQGLIKVQGKRAYSYQRVKKGEKISYSTSISFINANISNLIPNNHISFYKKLYSKILIKDTNDWICINKPNNIAVQGGSNQKLHIDDFLKVNFKNFQFKPKLVHRLDKETSGLLLIAKNQIFARNFSKYFKERKIFKIYYALVSPSPKKEDGLIKTKINKIASPTFNKMIISDSIGKLSITKYKIVQNLGEKLALVALFPITGRTHQLRLHMQHIGCPIIGDKKYFLKQLNNDAKTFKNDLKLHAAILKIPGEQILQAKLPEHFKQALEFYGLSIENKENLIDYFERGKIE